ncbi:DUF6918 family protein [Altericista sp. CCNU0014]|uniref:DUF6918 family protein n=1 Tax=Altericista sp. CCNU0014 TaxID=3082949 RepID=UPI00384CAFD0
MGLSEQLADEGIASRIAEDCAKLMDEQVSCKSGVSGMAFKATYKVVKGLSADYIPGAIQRLLPEAISALEPMWEKGIELGDPVSYLTQNCELTADTILSVTDAKIQRARNKLICTSYNQLRKSVKSDISAAVPGFAEILSKHAHY